MGAWGPDTFENDAACDWSYALEETTGLGLIESTLARAGPSDNSPPDADTACEVLAAADTLCRLMGRAGQRDVYTETVDAWAAANPVTPPSTLVKQALHAVDHVTAPDSELTQLWDEADRADWDRCINALRQRLRA